MTFTLQEESARGPKTNRNYSMDVLDVILEV